MSYNTNHLSRSSWNRISNIVKSRDESFCQYCEKYAPNGEPDHILPLSRGGRDSTDNLVWSCIQCNREKKDRTLREWILSTRQTEQKQESFKKPTTISLCIDWLLDFVPREGVFQNKVIKEGSKLNFSDSMVKRAKQTINNNVNIEYAIKSIRTSTRWVWVKEKKNGKQEMYQ